MKIMYLFFCLQVFFISSLLSQPDAPIGKWVSIGPIFRRLWNTIYTDPNNRDHVFASGTELWVSSDGSLSKYFCCPSNIIQLEADLTGL